MSAEKARTRSSGWRRPITSSRRILPSGPACSRIARPSIFRWSIALRAQPLVLEGRDQRRGELPRDDRAVVDGDRAGLAIRPGLGLEAEPDQPGVLLALVVGLAGVGADEVVVALGVAGHGLPLRRLRRLGRELARR